MSFQIWFAYMLACWVISVSPGAGAIASMSSGLNYGFRRGYWNVVGLQLALIVQIIIVAAGVGVLFATTPLAFLVVKWFGVLYLLYLAYLQWTAPTQSIDIQTDQTRSFMNSFMGHLFYTKSDQILSFLQNKPVYGQNFKAPLKRVFSNNFFMF